MKIAMPTDDRKTLAAHFGRAAEFAIYEAADGEAKQLEYRPNLHVRHAAAQHGRGQQAAHGGGGGGFEESLAGVDALICKGMGRRAEEACAALGIDVVFAAEADLDEVAGKFARGELAEADPSCERGEGHHA
jgi:predicted Fe-Mo cluster-binding NifX family protein